MTGLLLYLANIITFLPEPPSIITYPSENQGPEEPDTPELVRKATRPSNSPAGQQVKVIASSTPLHIAVPIPDLEQDAPTEEFFTGIEIGDGIAFDDGEGPGWDKPDTDVLSKRCDLNDRMKRITETEAPRSARKPWSNPSSGSRSSRTGTAPGGTAPRITSAP